MSVDLKGRTALTSWSSGATQSEPGRSWRSEQRGARGRVRRDVRPQREGPDGASRAALELLTKAWAAEYGPSGVRVNAVAPGPTRTQMMATVPIEMANHAAAMAPARRIAEPEELAAAIVFLASDDASFIHGVTLAVDGGRTAV